MTVDVRQPWTQEQFFTWAQSQEYRYEFDGSVPVSMTCENLGHALISRNIRTSLHGALCGTGYRSFGADAGLETAHKAVRYPDALITCSKIDFASHLIPGVVVVFEVLGSGSRSTYLDRIIKVQEYATVPSIQTYILVESSSVGITVLERNSTDDCWMLRVLRGDDILRIPNININLSIATIYEDIEFS